MVLGIIATLIALAGLLAALGHAGYLAMLSNAARKKGLSGAQIASDAKGRWPVAGGAAAVALLGLLITIGGDGGADVLGLLLGAGGGIVGWRAQKQLGSRYHTN